MAAYPEILPPSGAEADAELPGTTVAAETGTPQGTAQVPERLNFGEDNKDLPEALQNKLRHLLDLAVKDAPTVRREEITRIARARAFWRGLQLGYFDPSDQQWHLPWEVRPDRRQTLDEEELPRYAFVTNYFQGFGLSVMAILSQDVPATRLWPQDPDQADDVATVEAGKKVVELIERNNRLKLLQTELAFYLWTDGKVGGFIRYVTDGQRFGYHPEEEYEQRLVKLGEDAYRCAQCGAETPVSQGRDICPQCGADLDEENLLPAPLVEVPKVLSVEQVPNGAEVISIVGGLELKTPLRANEMHEYGYLVWQMEVHRARLQAAYPERRKKLGRRQQSEFESERDGARQARLQASGSGADQEEDLLTFTRGWLRPWWFENIEDDTPLPEYGGKTCTEVLKALYPTGCYVEFAADTYLISRNESMDDSWRVMHAYPGDGQDRPAIGTSFISVQERINTLENIAVETAEYGLPASFAAPWAVDFEAFKSTVVEPNALYPATDPPPGRALAEGFYTLPGAQMHPATLALVERLEGEVGQFITGAFPALFGGDPGTDTVGGTMIQRDQALGRIGLVWRRSLYFWAELALLGIDCFRKNRPDDVKISVEGPGGERKADWIRRADLKGNLLAYPDTDSQYPTSLVQKRAVVDKLMASPDPYLQKVLAHPENLSRLKRIIGLEDLVIPDDEARQKQHREIELLLAAAPMQNMEAQLDPVTQQPKPVTTFAASVPVDPEFDNNQVEFETIQRWMNSEAGQKAKVENPAGFANVRAHGIAHLEGQLMQAQRAQLLAQGGGPAPDTQEATPDGG